MGRIIGNIEETIMKKKRRKKKDIRCPYCGSEDIEAISDIVGPDMEGVKFRCKRCKKTF